MQAGHSKPILHTASLSSSKHARQNDAEQDAHNTCVLASVPHLPHAMIVPSIHTALTIQSTAENHSRGMLAAFTPLLQHSCWRAAAPHDPADA
eukprot:CAMPEP_0181306736 /NCGR_PEP_ID=MMETSP1101-20121128/10472_1 /TAXON_ID=46948 /ORGANISM="Rhodomonas abbreviata, Strain Caron Lab Isolate" /LENGTH=92 /DNA_ID=CAMNT_0023412839 /DNA_START=895 /DNA_END=1170 /DNA_ORIENTATION=+